MSKQKVSVLELFGNVVRSHREALGMSQEELAARAKLHRTYVGSVERGERNISLKNIFLFARALNISTGRLLTQVDDLL
ncbi:MAG: helix-turn-helix transcriptional regulator [Phycisphaeraceae bacterium]